MPSSMTEGRIARLKRAVQSARPTVCAERALIWTSYHRRVANRFKSPHIRMAEALAQVLDQKTIAIHPDELIVGNYTSKRVGGSIYPELHGVPVMLDLFRFSRRKTNPLDISARDRYRLLGIIPYWSLRFMPLKAYASPWQKVRFVTNQLRAHFYLINESGGIAHLAPDYEKLITVGTGGIVAEAGAHLSQTLADDQTRQFYEAVIVIAKALARFGDRYAALAREMAGQCEDQTRKRELEAISQICGTCLRRGAGSFRGALQAVFLAQIAINLESLDNAICPGRMDQYLWSFYQKDVEQGKLTREVARELIAAFCIKMSEIIPVFSKHLIDFHGGMFNGQVVTVGGMDREGKDATNELSYLFLEVMDALRMRQPNFHARMHEGSPDAYQRAINTVLAGGANSPALYNDEVIVETMRRQGYTVEDARDYTAVGCVEPVCQGKSFASTDAALFNTPLVLELALNRGRRFGSPVRTGTATEPVSRMRSMADVTRAFEVQLKTMLGRMITDLRAVEISNRHHHPTPLTSMLLDGCLASGWCSTAGGAAYNFSGIQCVGPVDTGDALYAIERAVFTDRRYSLAQLVDLLKRDIYDPSAEAYLRGIEKFGNDCEAADRWTRYVVDAFVDCLSAFSANTRGGPYTAGLYSVTAHEFFGRVTGALPHGRRKGQAFASGIAPLNGMDRCGPTALLNSVNRMDFTRTANGINLNLKFDPHTLRGTTGVTALGSLVKTYFRRGGMQVQVNVLDPAILKQARDNPDLYPHLLVRVSGYSAYFNDLSPDMKDEIIRRSTQQPTLG
ncbi:MAG: formate acetyltransferase [Desulfosarcina sp.]|nr:formate acetyltransferase [Desulfosarcina sp.]MBC2742707.1 formate acetyltransferase [Desulfosarcina sp.]MBC2765617.1 formate acetyltransferase [Desulfosarcina sp.]